MERIFCPFSRRRWSRKVSIQSPSSGSPHIENIHAQSIEQLCRLLQQEQKFCDPCACKKRDVRMVLSNDRLIVIPVQLQTSAKHSTSKQLPRLHMYLRNSTQYPPIFSCILLGSCGDDYLVRFITNEGDLLTVSACLV
jgi:hypothetical protein